MAKKRETKSPLNDDPVRNPGQGLDEEIDRLLNDKAMNHIMVMAMVGLLVFWEWVKAVLKQPPHPLMFSILGLLVWGFCIHKLVSIRRQLRNLALARKGERYIGQFLDEKARPMGYHVLHDIVGKGFNVDHVLVGLGGVFAVETKTVSKPAKRESRVAYDGQHITVDGFTPDRDPVVQAKACANWVRDILKRSTGREIPVRPVVLYPGWYVDRMPRGADVWVLNEKPLITFLRNETSKLSDEDVAMIADHLKRHVIGRERENR